MDHSEQIGDFYQAFRNAKMEYNIPKNRPPDYWTENYNKQDKLQNGRVYVYFVTVDGVKVMLEFRDDCSGHEFENNIKLPGHINGPNGEHYFHNGFGQFDNIKNHKTKEEHEKNKEKYLEPNKKLIKKMLQKGKI